MHDSPLGLIVRGHLHPHPVSGKHLYMMDPHFSGKMAENQPPVIKLYPKKGIRKILRYRTFQIRLILFRHSVIITNYRLEGNQKLVNFRVPLPKLSVISSTSPMGLISQYRLGLALNVGINYRHRGPPFPCTPPPWGSARCRHPLLSLLIRLYRALLLSSGVIGRGPGSPAGSGRGQHRLWRS